MTSTSNTFTVPDCNFAGGVHDFDDERTCNLCGLRLLSEDATTRPNTRDTGTCECGEPVEEVEGLDRVWRWAHEVRGVVRNHVATPVG